MIYGKKTQVNITGCSGTTQRNSRMTNKRIEALESNLPSHTGAGHLWFVLNPRAKDHLYADLLEILGEDEDISENYTEQTNEGNRRRNHLREVQRHSLHRYIYGEDK